MSMRERYSGLVVFIFVLFFFPVLMLVAELIGS